MCETAIELSMLVLLTIMSYTHVLNNDNRGGGANYRMLYSWLITKEEWLITEEGCLV
jgi:hypothetical protein